MGNDELEIEIIEEEGIPVEFLKPEEEVTEEEKKSFYKQLMDMGVAEKIKTALKGNKEVRTILIKDSNKLVSTSVVKNPRITDNEVIMISKSKNVNEEVLRLIGTNKEWVKNYNVIHALVENSKTPLSLAMSFLTRLTEKDLINLTKNKNVSSAITTQAKRMVLAKKK